MEKKVDIGQEKSLVKQGISLSMMSGVKLEDFWIVR